MNDLLVTPKSKTKIYTPHAVESKNNRYSGQLKLAAGNIRFLSDVPNGSVVVSIGAAPGHHMPALINLLRRSGREDIIFELWDKTPFNALLEQYSNVIIHQEYFTDDVAREVKGRIASNKLYFISDIRTNETGENPTEKDIVENNDQQRRWVEIMRPVSSMLKFRTPFPSSDHAPDNVYPYLQGEVDKQVYGPKNSAETRLIVRRPLNDKPYPQTVYSKIVHERVMAYHNCCIRPCKYLNPFTGNEDPINHIIDNDWDGVMLFVIMRYYTVKTIGSTGYDVAAKTLKEIDTFLSDMEKAGYTNLSTKLAPKDVIHVKDVDARSSRSAFIASKVDNSLFVTRERAPPL